MFLKLSSIVPWHFIAFIPLSFIIFIYWLGFWGFFLAIISIIVYYSIYLASVLASARRKMLIMNQGLFACLGLIARNYPLDFDSLLRQPAFYVPKREIVETAFFYAKDNPHVSVQDAIPDSFISWSIKRPYIKLMFAEHITGALPQSALLDPRVVPILREIYETLGAENLTPNKDFVVEGEVVKHD